MTRAVETLFHFGPLIFAVLFLWPLAAQALMRVGVAFDIATLASAVIALPLGVVAQVRGRWL